MRRLSIIFFLLASADWHNAALGGDLTLIKAAAYLDVTGGRLVSPATILVEDAHIKQINPRGVPDGTKLVDLGDLVVLPGLMDAHTHLTMDIVEGWEHEPTRWTDADYALRGVVNARKTLWAGFTTVRDIYARGFSDVSLARAIDRGWVPGPHMIPSGHGIGITGGHCDTTGFGPGVVESDYRSGAADGVDEVLKAVRYQIKHGAQVVKVCATAGVLSDEGPVGAQQMSLEELRAAAQEAHRHGIKVAAHAHGTEGIIAASEAGIDSIEHGSIITEEAAQVIKRNGTYVTPTLYLTRAIKWDALPPHIQAKARKVLPLADESFKLAVRRGLKLVFGTDSAVFPHGDNAREFKVRVDLGQSPLEAVRSATIHTAELFGTPDRGQIKAGLLADLIAVEGNPLEDVTVLEKVRFVMKAGRIYKSQ